MMSALETFYPHINTTEKHAGTRMCCLKADVHQPQTPENTVYSQSLVDHWTFFKLRPVRHPDIDLCLYSQSKHQTSRLKIQQGHKPAGHEVILTLCPIKFPFVKL